MMRYYAVQESSADKLTETVNELIQKGWRPLGGMSVGGDQGYWYFCQAMIKEAA